MILPGGPYNIRCDRSGCKKRTNYAKAGWYKASSLTGTEEMHFCSADCLADWSAAEAASVSATQFSPENPPEEGAP